MTKGRQSSPKDTVATTGEGLIGQECAKAGMTPSLRDQPLGVAKREAALIRRSGLLADPVVAVTMLAFPQGIVVRIAGC